MKSLDKEGLNVGFQYVAQLAKDHRQSGDPSNFPGCHCQIRSFPFAFLFVECQSWNLHILNGSGLVELGRDQPSPLDMFCPDFHQRTGKEVFLQYFTRQNSSSSFL